MAVSDSRRHDLYHGLDALLGTELADTLMAYLPAHETTEVATKDDIHRLEIHLDRVDARFERLDDHLERIEARVDVGLDAVNRRLDRFFVTQSAGLIAIVGALMAAVLL